MFTICYNYSDALSKSLYVASGGPLKTGLEFKINSSELSVKAREASLTALVSGRGTLCSDPREVDVDDRLYAACNWPNGGNVTIKIGPVDTEPLRADALSDVELALVAAAVAASSVLEARHVKRFAAQEAKEKRKEESIRQILGEPLTWWIKGDVGAYVVGDYQSAPSGLPNRVSELVAMDPRLASRVKEASAEAERLNEEAWKEVDKNNAERRALLVEHGAVDMVERFDADVLPEEELRDLACRQLFACMADLPPYARIKESEIGHTSDCHEPSPRFRATPVEGEPLTFVEWDALKKVRAAAPEGAEVTLMEHSGWCRNDECDSWVVRRRGVRVKLSWAGLDLVQEYACG